jgi:hypothetical protein
MKPGGILVVILLIIVLVGATGGDSAVSNIGHSINRGLHWVSVAWDSLTG